MIDVNKITSTLAKLPDQQLQQYAQMHKNDPYIMALAMSESNRRKELRASGQGAMQEQPKVVDQMVAEMAPEQLPEEMGIGQLPAGEMNFAGGGIVAFADGGDVERYNGQYGSLTGDVQRILQKSPAQRTPQENAILQQAGVAMQSRSLGADSGVGATNTFLETLGPRIRNYFTEGASQLSNEELAARPNVGGVMNERILRSMGVDPAATRSAAPTVAPSTPAADLSGMDRRLMAGSQPNTPSFRTPLPPKDKGKGADKTGRGAPTDKAAAPIPAAQTEGLGALDPNKLFATALAGASKEERPEKGMLEKLMADRTTAAEAELAGTKALNERFADAFKGRRERLDTREGAIGKMKDQNFGLALLQAGAAMMSTPGSLGTSIGRGIQTGSQQYVAGIDKINAAKDKLADARDRLDDLQLNRDEMSAREILKAEAKIRETALSGQENMIKFVMERDKVDRETAMKIVDNQIKIGLSQAENVSRENAARIAAGPGYQRNQMLKDAQGNESKVRAEYGKLQAKVMDTLSKDDNYKMANPVQQQVLYTNALRQAISTNPFLASYAADIGFSKAPSGTGKVYDLTGE